MKIYTMRWRNLENVVLNEISQTKKDKHCIIPLKGTLEKVYLLRYKVEKWFPGLSPGGECEFIV